MQPTVLPLRHTLHCILVVNTDGRWQTLITTTVELTILLASDKRIERLASQGFGPGSGLPTTQARARIG
jgi:hypothetical protein